jgi:hypothetical protein
MRDLPNTRYPTQKAESAIALLLHILLQDLIDGAEKEDAGWRTPSSIGMPDADLRELRDLHAIETNAEGQVRFNMNNRQMCKAVHSLQQELTQLDYFLEKAPVIKQDRERLKRAEDLLEQVCQALQEHPETWAYIIWVGWWKMLESSDLPAPVDLVLKEGFSPKDWAVEVSLACPDLALSIAEKFGTIDAICKTQEYFKKKNLVPANESPPVLPRENIEKIKGILRWEEITEAFDVGLTKELAFVWASLYFLENKDLIARSEEASVALYDTIWDRLKGLLNEDQTTLLEKLKDVVVRLSEQGITCAADIIQVPEVI